MRRLSIVIITLIFLFSLENIFAAEKMIIEIVPLGSIDNLILEYLKNNLGDIFDAEVHLDRPQPIPEYAYNEKRGQYLSPAILNNLSGNIKNKQGKVLAIIDKDLYVPKLNFVFGQALPLEGVSIISITRLYPAYYGLKADQDILLKRTLKEAVHEIGHLFNLGHCQDLLCVMHFSNNISDTDRKDYHLCDVCKKRLAASESNSKNYVPVENKRD